MEPWIISTTGDQLTLDGLLQELGATIAETDDADLRNQARRAARWAIWARQAATEGRQVEACAYMRVADGICPMPTEDQ